MKHVKFIFLLILIIFVISLVVQNHGAFSKEVAFKFDLFSIHFKTPEISLYYIIPFSFLLGVIVIGLYGMWERYQLTRQIKILKSVSNEKDKELNSLRNLPITSENVGSNHLNGNGNDL